MTTNDKYVAHVTGKLIQIEINEIRLFAFGFDAGLSTAALLNGRARYWREEMGLGVVGIYCGTSRGDSSPSFSWQKMLSVMSLQIVPRCRRVASMGKKEQRSNTGRGRRGAD